MMNLFNRKPHVTLDDIHQYVADITELQNQRAVAASFGNVEEVQRCEADIEAAQKVLERLLEQVE